jgi:biopolymer transport protein TolR
MARRPRKRRRPISDINVVPYIDVMLVLLVIFMITAPLLTQGVDVELPQANAEALAQKPEAPLVVTLDAAGTLYMDPGTGKEQAVDGQTLKSRVAEVLRDKPKTQVLVRGDHRVDYGQVIRAMVLLQAAGAPSVGLITDPPPEKKAKR